jgi:hypothetical protein
MTGDRLEKAEIVVSLAEQKAWAKIEASTKIADFENFRKKWPNGAYAAKAKARIHGLKAWGLLRPVVVLLLLFSILIDFLPHWRGSWAWRQLYTTSSIR